MLFSFTTLVLLATLAVSIKGFNDPAFFEKYKFNISAIQHGQQYRLFSSGFLHADVMHLAFNMLSFYSFSTFLSGFFTPFQLALLYFGSMLLGSVFTYYIHKNEPYYSAIGASGGVSGVIYCAILLNPSMTIYMPIPMPGYVFGILYLFYSVYGMRGRFDNIGHTAHFGGAIAGLLLTVVLFPTLLVEKPLFLGLMCLPIMVLFVLLRYKKM
ncbi:rhomboid family intramembrane serine protease [Flavobacterium sp. 20NA77.7]|uniref:Rhomboid family intramembrane serine protease n=1 Tax=Flavobacterium nakdongensis TaxID=3073563 RepID=A0ABY9RA14_9FLAO|nr:rhomboid family intramembrane serine protease [Flavobacterium sp. 20NA77.7]WMW77051.1 rhomboid family intramembrane serine protease [Flavobacterium sp. 20NA77.7]